METKETNENELHSRVEFEEDELIQGGFYNPRGFEASMGKHVEAILNKSELNKIINHLNTQGVTVIPLAVILEGKYAKVKIGVARGKKKYDKRESIKKRETKRQIDRAMKRHI